MPDHAQRRADHQRIDAEGSPAGWRWLWTSANGVQHLGQEWHPRRAHAVAAGHHWLDHQTVGHRRPT